MAESRSNPNRYPADATYESGPIDDGELALFRETVRRFVATEMVPKDAEWRKQQHVGHQIWRRAGEIGLLCADIPAEYGGMGGSFFHEAVVHEELARHGISGFGVAVHSICAHYPSRNFRTRGSSSRKPPPSRGSRVYSSAIVSPRSPPARLIPQRPPWRSGGRPTCSRRCSMYASSCTAAMGT
jgi:hypothetical protein